MTLQQTLNANASRSKELFEKLEQTSDQAIKTRENLFEELSRELDLHLEMEQRDLLPALRKNDETRDLATAAAKSNREIRSRLDELGAMAKGDKDFHPRLVELRKLFQQQLRDERKELVPAVRQNLSDKQIEAVEDKIEARLTQAEEDERARADQLRDQVRREREQARDDDKAAASRKRAATEVAEATRRSARQAARSASDAVRDGTRAVEETGQRVAENVSDTARRLRAEAADTVETYRDTARERGLDVRAVAEAVRTLNGVGRDLRAVMFSSLRRSGRDSLETARRLLREPRQFGEVQRDYAAAATRNAMESTQEMLDILRRASSNARKPVDQRLRQAG